MDAHSLYLHVPFCTHRCCYCDFNTYAGLESLIPAYVSALCRELEFLRTVSETRLPVHTIFFGGGTPSLLPPAELSRIISSMDEAFDLLPGLEITLEANPGTLTRSYLNDLRKLHVNRLSLGMQSARPEELRLLERQHDFGDVSRSVAWARAAGFDNLNLDLIFGLPYQGLEAWQTSLELALGLAPDHFSLYALTLEHGTPLAHWAARGQIEEPDPDLAAEMYDWAADRLEQRGYSQYEISNWARSGEGGVLMACRHNLQYWRNQPYLGIGAGAHGYAAGLRTANVLSPRAYIQRFLSNDGDSAAPRLSFPLTPATVHAESIDRRAEMGETMMMGLRLTREGVSRSDFRTRFGREIEDVFGDEIETLRSQGLLSWGDGNGGRLQLTSRGRLLGNQVFIQFI
jgi:oxygen-independent coproporphyrinogen-3 oxidase